MVLKTFLLFFNTVKIPAVLLKIEYTTRIIVENMRMIGNYVESKFIIKKCTKK